MLGFLNLGLILEAVIDIMFGLGLLQIILDIFS